MKLQACIERCALQCVSQLLATASIVHMVSGHKSDKRWQFRKSCTIPCQGQKLQGAIIHVNDSYQCSLMSKRAWASMGEHGRRGCSMYSWQPC
jgi:hypothetical protein